MASIMFYRSLGSHFLAQSLAYKRNLIYFKWESENSHLDRILRTSNESEYFAYKVQLIMYLNTIREIRILYTEVIFTWLACIYIHVYANTWSMIHEVTCMNLYRDQQTTPYMPNLSHVLFCIACKLRMILIFLNSWKNIKEE